MICTALKDKEIENEKFYKKDINSGEEKVEQKSLSELLDKIKKEDFIIFVDKINKCFDKYVGDIPTLICKSFTDEKEYEK